MTILAVGSLSMAVCAQQSAADQLLPVLGTEKVTELQSSNPEQLEFLAFVNRQGYYTQDLGAHGKDISAYPDALAIQPKHEASQMLSEDAIESGFDLLAYHFPLQNNKYGYYRIGETGVLLVVYPLDLARVLFEKEQQ